MARTFNGTTQYLTTGSAPVTAPPLTMACWCKTTSATPAANQTLMSIVNSGGQQLYLLYQLAATGVMAAQAYSGASAEATTTTNPAANTWSHAAAVFATTSDRRAYLNGGNKGTNAVLNIPTGINGVAIGAYWYSGGQIVLWIGDIAEAAIWSAALTDADIAVLALGVSPLLVRPDALALYAPLVGQYAPEIDLLGHRDLTLANSPAASVHPRLFQPDPTAAVARHAIGAGAGGRFFLVFP